jgi:outer membrane immunogenic protein
MRRLLIATVSVLALTHVASGADLPRKAPPAPLPPPVYNWTGFYIGGNVGWSWSRLSNSLSIANGAPGYFLVGAIPGVLASGLGGLDDNSFTGGLQLGYNFQSGQFVYGFEADINWMNHNPSYGGTFLYTTNGAPYNLTGSSSIDWLATIRARLGMTVGSTGSTLIYLTGGLALTEIKFNQAFSEPPFTAAPLGTPQFASISDVKAGWTVGGGVETALTGNWRVKAEYLFVRFDPGDASGSFSGNGAGGAGSTSTITNSLSHLDIHVARVGVNYKF